MELMVTCDVAIVHATVERFVELAQHGEDWEGFGGDAIQQIYLKQQGASSA